MELSLLAYTLLTFDNNQNVNEVIIDNREYV